MVAPLKKDEKVVPSSGKRNMKTFLCSGPNWFLKGREQRRTLMQTVCNNFILVVCTDTMVVTGQAKPKLTIVTTEWLQTSLTFASVFQQKPITNVWLVPILCSLFYYFLRIRKSKARFLSRSPYRRKVGDCEKKCIHVTLSMLCPKDRIDRG